MKIRLKIDPNISRESLIAKLPLIVQSAIQAALEKSSGIESHIEKGGSHSIPAVARGEDDIYAQGRDVISGIHSWILRSLKIETDLKKSTLSEETYREQMLEKYGVSLGDNVSINHARDIDDVLATLPKEFVSEKLKKITTDGRFGSSKSRYPNHGRYIDSECKIILNPAIFGVDTDYKNLDGKRISKLAQTLIHEIGHGIDDKYGLSDKKEWREISGWMYIGLDSEPPEGYERLWIKDEGRTVLKGRWAYKKDTVFPRWYGARNPKEDFCESLVFAFLGCPELFHGESGQKKLAFVKEVIGKLEKSDNPGIGLELAGDEELLKSQEFGRYFETRQSSLLDRDEIEAAQIIKSEFSSDVCDDLYLEKAGTAAPGVPGAGAHPQAGAAGAANMKGMQKPGHKYLYRKQNPDGSYRYFYQMPSGDHYHSDEALHDEGKHLPHMKNEQEWANHNAAHGGVEQLAEGGLIPQARKGEVETHQYDPIPVPDLIPGLIEPNETSFDGNSEQELDDKKEGPAWRENNPKRAAKNFLLVPGDEKEIEACLRSREIAEIDDKFSKGGVNVKFKVKLKDDGWAIMKPKAASLMMDTMRSGISEMSAVHREALAYNIDKTLKWNLVPPTVCREVKGMGQRRLVSSMQKMFGEPDEMGNGEKKAMDALTSDKVREASLQFFAAGAQTFNDLYADAKFLDRVSIKELVRATLFDMIINHQDRHGGNLMLMEDNSADERYGGEYRMVLIDNGYSMGNGVKTNCRVYENAVKFRVSNQYLDKETVRDLRELRDDIRDQRRRRKIVDGDIRKNIPHDQIKRIADRIDYILSNRDAKKRVKMPDWRELATWEQEHFPAKHTEHVKAAHNPFDITGRTALVDKRDGAPEQFKGAGAMQDFLHPMLDFLNKRQMENANDLVTAFGHFKQGKLNHNAFREAIVDFNNRLPKKLANQLFMKQKFHERFGLPDRVVDHIHDDVKFYLDRDMVTEYEKAVKDKDIEVYNKMKRGEIDREGLRRAIGENLFQKMDDRWLLPKKMRSVEMQDKTQAIFDNPRAFGWQESKEAKEDRKRLGGSPETDTDAMSSGPRRQEKLKAREGRMQDKANLPKFEPFEGDDKSVEGVQRLKVKKAKAAGPKEAKFIPNKQGFDKRLELSVENDLEKSDEEFLIVLE